VHVALLGARGHEFKLEGLKTLHFLIPPKRQDGYAVRAILPRPEGRGLSRIPIRYY
jgi:hypothetical protein